MEATLFVITPRDAPPGVRVCTREVIIRRRPGLHEETAIGRCIQAVCCGGGLQDVELSGQTREGRTYLRSTEGRFILQCSTPVLAKCRVRNQKSAQPGDLM